MSYLPDKDKMAPTQESYLPPGVKPAGEKKEEETIKIISPPVLPPSDVEIRMKALEASVLIPRQLLPGNRTTDSIITDAKKLESYLRGDD